MHIGVFDLSPPPLPEVLGVLGVVGRWWGQWGVVGPLGVVGVVGEWGRCPSQLRLRCAAIHAEKCRMGMA